MLFLLLAGEVHNRRTTVAYANNKVAIGLGIIGHFLRPNHFVDLAQASAAILFRPVEAGKSRVGHFFVPAFGIFIAFGLGGSTRAGLFWARIGSEPLAYFCAKRCLFGGIFEVHCQLRCLSS